MKFWLSFGCIKNTKRQLFIGTNNCRFYCKQNISILFNKKSLHSLCDKDLEYSTKQKPMLKIIVIIIQKMCLFAAFLELTTNFNHINPSHIAVFQHNLYAGAKNPIFRHSSYENLRPVILPQSRHKGIVFDIMLCALISRSNTFILHILQHCPPPPRPLRHSRV